jgi:hypothetical protein
VVVRPAGALVDWQALVAQVGRRVAGLVARAELGLVAWAGRRAAGLVARAELGLELGALVALLARWVALGYWRCWRMLGVAAVVPRGLWIW